MDNKNQLALSTGFSEQQIQVIKDNVAKGTTDTELAYFLNVCKSAGLNPFIKEIWCYKDNKNNLLVFAGRDGFLSKAQQSPEYAGIRSSEIRQNDEWEIDIPNGIVKHKITKVGKDRGEIIGAYAFVFRQHGEPTIEFVEFDVYNKKYNTWGTHPADMIKKVAETHALKKAFGISGIQCEYDYEVKGTIVEAIDTTKHQDLTETQQKAIELLKTAVFDSPATYKIVETKILEGEDGALKSIDYLKTKQPKPSEQPKQKEEEEQLTDKDLEIIAKIDAGEEVVPPEPLSDEEQLSLFNSSSNDKI